MEREGAASGWLVVGEVTGKEKLDLREGAQHVQRP